MAEGGALAWKAKGLGGGDSTPSVAAGRIYSMSDRSLKFCTLKRYHGFGLFLLPQRASADQAPSSFSFLRELTVISPVWGSNVSRLYCSGMPVTCSLAGAPKVPAPTM